MNIPSSDHIEKWFRIGFPASALLCAIINGIVALIFYRKMKNKYRHYLQTEGVVSGIVKEKEEMNYPVLKFRTSTQEYEVRSTYGRSPWDIKAGDAVPVIYNQNNPLEAEIENKLVQYLLPLFFAAGCILGLIAAPVIYFLMKRM